MSKLETYIILILILKYLLNDSTGDNSTRVVAIVLNMINPNLSFGDNLDIKFIKHSLATSS